MDIKNIIKGMTSVGYYDLDVMFTDEQLGSFVKFLKGRDLAFIHNDGDDFIIDKELLAHVINMDCFNCYKYNQRGCCFDSPFPMSQATLENFEFHAVDIAKTLAEYLGGEADGMEQLSSLICHGGLLDNGEVNAANGRCAFLVKDKSPSDSMICVIHRFALEHKIPIYELSPLSCLMFPVEILTVYCGDEYYYYIGSVCDQDFWNQFGRWFNYSTRDNFDLRCLDQGKHAKDGFAKKKYRPVYQEFKGLLTHEFGEAFYKNLCKVMES